MIYILATIQVIIFGWKIGPVAGIIEGNRGSSVKMPMILGYIIKYVTPAFLIGIFTFFLYQSLPEYINKMNPVYMVARAQGVNEAAAATKAYIALGVFACITLFFILIAFVVHLGLKRQEKDA